MIGTGEILPTATLFFGLDIQDFIILFDFLFVPIRLSFEIRVHGTCWLFDYISEKTMNEIS